MRSDSEETRERILDEALRLFAEQGVFEAPLRQIGASAGQRNTSAVQYHFRNREGLIQALVARVEPELTQRRAELLAARSAPFDAIETARSIFLPLTDMLDGTWRDWAYLQLMGEVTTHPAMDFDAITAVVGGETANQVNVAIEEILATADPLTPALRDERVRAGAHMSMHLLAAHASSRSRSEGAPPRLPSSVVLANLADMYVAALCAPPSNEAAAHVGQHRDG